MKPSWDSKEMKGRYRNSAYCHNSGSELREVYRNTVQIVKQGWYVTESGERVTLPSDDDLIRHTIMVTDPFSVADRPTLCEDAEITIINSDSLDAGKALLDDGYKPAVLNFADAYEPGGLVIEGASTQEEAIFRRSNMFRSLYQFHDYYARQFEVPQPQSSRYPMQEQFGGIYTPSAIVFREGPQEGFRLLEKPYPMSVISVAAINCPQLNERGLMAEKAIGTTRNKMRTILRLGVKGGHDALVLGAWGCGAFCNPPAQIAQLFRETINDPEFRGKFRRITFAVYASSENNRNFQAFVQDFA